MTVLVLDNRDSFVFNLVDELEARGEKVVTVRSEIPLAKLQHRLGELKPHLVILSPGPGRPEDAGVMVPWLRTDPSVPVLGICLGHQALAVADGGSVGPAPRPVHGQKDRIDVDENDPAFRALGPAIVVARYHSLVVRTVPETMRVVATTMDGGERLIMGLRHRRHCRLGLQFHPESILTPYGRSILFRFHEEAQNYGGKP